MDIQNSVDKEYVESFDNEDNSFIEDDENEDSDLKVIKCPYCDAIVFEEGSIYHCEHLAALWDDASEELCFYIDKFKKYTINFLKKNSLDYDDYMTVIDEMNFQLDEISTESFDISRGYDTLAYLIFWLPKKKQKSEKPMKLKSK